MECPGCKKDLGICMYKDKVICNDCGKEIVISYNACRGCGFTWRDNNGRFMDGNVIDEESISEVLGGLDEIIKSQPLLNDENVPPEAMLHLDKEIEAMFESVADERTEKSMLGMIHRCIKCGEIAIPIDKFNYKCPFCDFEWEILGEQS